MNRLNWSFKHVKHFLPVIEDTGVRSFAMKQVIPYTYALYLLGIGFQMPYSFVLKLQVTTLTTSKDLFVIS